MYAALMRVLPNDAGTGGTEITGTGYAAVAVPTTDAGMSAPAAGTGNQRVTSNVGVITFSAAAGSDWAPAGSEVIGVALYDDPTLRAAANFIGSGALPAPKVIQSGDPVSIPATDLDIIFAGT